MSQNTKNDCRCNKTACGCASAEAQACNCGNACKCTRQCSCPAGCGCAIK